MQVQNVSLQRTGRTLVHLLCSLQFQGLTAASCPDRTQCVCQAVFRDRVPSTWAQWCFFNSKSFNEDRLFPKETICRYKITITYSRLSAHTYTRMHTCTNMRSMHSHSRTCTHMHTHTCAHSYTCQTPGCECGCCTVVLLDVQPIRRAAPRHPQPRPGR